jgi:hypothetical protein
MLSELYRTFIQILQDFRDNILELFFWDIQNWEYENNDSEDTQNLNLISNCPDCINLYTFIRCNAPIFTVIGIIGTMLSLIPNFLNNFVGSNWEFSLISGSGGFLELAVILVVIESGCLLIFALSLLILGRLYSCSFSPIRLHSFFGLNITRGRVQKWVFSFLFIPLILTIVYFLLPVFIWSDSPYIQSLTIVVMGTYTILILFIVLFVFIVTPRVDPLFKSLLLIVILIAFTGTLYVLVTSAYIPFFSSMDAKNGTYYGNVEIMPVYTNYSFDYPTSYGLPLKVAGEKYNISNLDSNYYLSFQWTTDYGYFLNVPTSNDIITNEGPYCKLSDGSSTVFWTYGISDNNKKKPPVHIFLRVENLRTNQVLSSDHINLSWSDLDNVTVSTT